MEGRIDQEQVWPRKAELRRVCVEGRVKEKV
jgi:hypothetical protein